MELSSSVNHPSHYNQGKFEVIEVIEDQGLDFHLGNALKYICRAGKKDPKKTVEDLQKAVWYLKRKIEVLQNPDGPMNPNDMNPRVNIKELKTLKELKKAVTQN
jgi:hypothetical protein